MSFIPTGTPVQRADRPSALAPFVALARLRQCVLCVEMGKGLHFRLKRRNLVEAGARIFFGRYRTTCNFRSRFGRGQRCQTFFRQFGRLRLSCRRDSLEAREPIPGHKYMITMQKITISI